jgi:hypothetical protein
MRGQQNIKYDKTYSNSTPHPAFGKNEGSLANFVVNLHKILPISLL